nr:ribonuclease H-like domain-containing protein [Tanacetum cinerariifolium]GEX56634.1 ribonuclease H-like domain-containing protein [Tanacetum cinerariifolium]
MDKSKFCLLKLLKRFWQERERKARTTLLMAIPEDHLAKFHKMTHAKEIWEAIKSRFGRNDESKEMKKYLLKQQFKSFSISNSQGLHKGYDRFQSLLSQLETHGAGVSIEDANQKFLRSLPSSWSQVSLIMRTKPGVDTLNFDDLYNNLRVFEYDVKGSIESSSSTHNMAFVSFDNTSSTNEVNTAFGDSTSSGHNSQKEGSSSYTDDLMCSFFSNQSNGVDWTGHAKDKTEDYALMGSNSSNSGSDTKMTAKDKSGLGYGIQIHDGVLSYENEVFASVFDTSSSKEILETVPKLVESKPKVVNEPNVLSNAPIIKEYESDSDDEYVSKASNPKVDQQDWTGLKSKGIGLGYDYTKKACFVCGSFSHLIRDCDFHEKRMAKQMELNKQKGKSTGPKENKPVWNNVQRINHQNKFVPTAILTKTGRFPVNVARQNFSSQAALTGTARKVNTARPKVNEIRPRNNLYMTHSPIRRPFNKTTAPKVNFAQDKVNTARDKTISAVGGKWEIVVKASTGCNWRYKRHYWNRVSKYNSRSKSRECVDIKDPLGRLKHMTGNKAYLVDYQDFNGVHVAFGGSIGQITDTECLVLSPDFKLPDENQVLLRVPRQHNMYSFNLENIVPCGGLACLIAKATVDESTKWHWRINREYSNARTPQQNRVIERKNRTLIEAARTMLAASFLPNTFWVEAVSTACYVLNRVLVTKPHNKTHYELLTGKISIIRYIRPFGCHVTILNTIDHLGKFEEKSNEGFLVGYSLSSKAFRVYNLKTKRVEENLHINFLENKHNVARKGPTWLFDLDYLTDSMNYQPITTENKSNHTAGLKETNNSAGTQDSFDAGTSEMEADHAQEYYVLPLLSSYTSTVKSTKAKNGDEKLNEDTDSKTNEKSIDQKDQAFFGGA